MRMYTNLQMATNKNSMTKQILTKVIILLVMLFIGVFSSAYAESADTLLQNENIFDTLSVDLKINGSDGPVEVAVGDRITISWESDGAKRCRSNFSKKDLPLNGKVSGRLNSSLVGSVTVRLACIDGYGNREDDTVILKITSSVPPPFKNPVTLPQKSDSVFIIEDDGTLVLQTGQVDPRIVAKKFYSLHPDKTGYDFLSIFTTFHTTFGIPNHDNLQNSVKGIGLNIYDATSASGVSPKLLGINFFNDTYSSKYFTTEKDLKNNLFLLNHETGHQWIAYAGKDIGLSDGSHYTKWVNNGFTRGDELWGDLAQGWPWKDNGGGTFSVRDIQRQGFSNLSLYLMGFIPTSEVPDIQILIPDDPKNPGLHNISAKTKTVSIKEIIAKYGERIPSYQNSQKNFKMAYILLTKKGEPPNQYQSDLDIIKLVAQYFQDEWNFITYGKSTINSP